MPHLDIHAFVEKRKVEIDRALDERLPAEDRQPVMVHKAMRYAVLTGGKRLRPLISLTVADLANKPAELVMDAACAVEYVHAASLVLDDLPSMDNATMRRGGASTHVEFDEATAILAAMGLVACAFDLVARNGITVGRPNATGEAVRELARAMGTNGIIQGQHIDLSLKTQSATAAELETISEHKAAALFLAAVRIPAFLVDLSEREMDALDVYGLNLGLSFQIVDDLIDAGAASEDAGRPTHASSLGESGARDRASVLTTEAIAALDIFADRADPLRALAEHVRTRTV